MNNECVFNGKNIVKIEPLDCDLFVFQWMLTRRCQFDCSYCPDFWHNKTAKNHSLSMMKFTIERIIKNLPKNPNRNFLISFTGGEPTTNKNLIPFLRWFSEKYKDKFRGSVVATNGTKSSEYYSELSKFSKINFTIHSEFANEEKTISTILKTNEFINNQQINNPITVFFVKEPWNIEIEEQYRKFFEMQGINYRDVTLNDFKQKDSHHPIRIFRKRFDFSSVKNASSTIGQHISYPLDCAITYSDNSTQEISTRQICDSHAQTWKGWKCSSHYSTVYINDTLEVYSCVGKNQCFGNIMEVDFQIPFNPLTCVNETCTTKGSDLRSLKYNPFFRKKSGVIE